VWLLKSALIALLSTPPVAAGPQDQAPAPTEANHEFFSGTVTDFSADRISVSRTVLGKPAEVRTFIITGETKIEGRPRAKGRVTVGFKSTDEGDVAVRIIVRNNSQQPKK
jgi:hypothetical protein